MCSIRGRCKCETVRRNTMGKEGGEINEHK